MYTKILVPNDGSEIAAAAIPHARSIALAEGAGIVLIHVVESPAHLLARTSGAWLPDGGVAVEATFEAAEAARAAAERELATMKQELEAAGVRPVEVYVVEGSAGSAIVEAASEHGCDLVVMSTHGRSGFKRAILGSVADHVIRHATVPVLLCRPREE